MTAIEIANHFAKRTPLYFTFLGTKSQGGIVRTEFSHPGDPDNVFQLVIKPNSPGFLFEGEHPRSGQGLVLGSVAVEDNITGSLADMQKHFLAWAVPLAQAQMPIHTDELTNKIVTFKPAKTGEYTIAIDGEQIGTSAGFTDLISILIEDYADTYSHYSDRVVTALSKKYSVSRKSFEIPLDEIITFAREICQADIPQFGSGSDDPNGAWKRV